MLRYLGAYTHRIAISNHRILSLDLEYIDNWTLAKDFEILFKTVPAVLRATGAS